MDATGITATSPECPECGMAPMGEGCYHICPNSTHFYSPEQERADEPFYGADRYDGWDDPDLDAEYGEDAAAELAEAQARGGLHPASSLYDLPF